MNPIRTISTCVVVTVALVGLGAAATTASADPTRTASIPTTTTTTSPTWTTDATPPATKAPQDALAGVIGRAGRWGCRGVPATDVVEAGGDFVGTDADEIIVVLGSNSHVQASGGDDTICVHGNHLAPHEFSTVFGGDGDDVILALSGGLEAWGDDGEDVLLGNGTEMWFFGGNDSDDLNAGGATSAIMDGGDWADRITGSPGPDVIQGGQGEDGIWGWDGADEIQGGTEDDAIHGGNGFDTLNGSDGDYDECYDVDSAVDGALIFSCTIHLTPDVADDIVFG